jgi:hypothetical protein
MTAPRQLRCVPSCVVVVCEFWFQLTVATSTAARGLEAPRPGQGRQGPGLLLGKKEWRKVADAGCHITDQVRVYRTIA